MNTRYLMLWLLILSLITARFLWPIGFSPTGGDSCSLAENAEARLACGAPLALSQVDLYDLELVPGFSDSLAQRILAKREQITQKAKLLPSGQEAKALEVVKGIGPKKARALGVVVDLRK